MALRLWQRPEERKYYSVGHRRSIDANADWERFVHAARMSQLRHGTQWRHSRRLFQEDAFLEFRESDDKRETRRRPKVWSMLRSKRIRFARWWRATWKDKEDAESASDEEPSREETKQTNSVEGKRGVGISLGSTISGDDVSECSTAEVIDVDNLDL